MSALRSRFCALVGCRIPIVQTGMGWVATPPLVAAVSKAGAFGILAGATLSLEELAASIAAVKAATDQPFGVNLRADAPDAKARVQLLIDEGVCLASFAAAPKKDLIDRLKGEGVLVMPTVGTLKRSSNGVSMRSSLKGMRVAAIPDPCPPVYCCRMWSTRSRSRCSQPAVFAAGAAWWLR